MTSFNIIQKLPEWYMIERETEKIINRLTTVKELDFYLDNPDEYIRRLALIRLSKLKLKDSENKLNEILSDYLETNDNKNLAAWALKAVYTKLKTEMIINNSLLSRYTGNETLNDIYKIENDDLQENIKLDFSAGTASLQLPSAQDIQYGAKNNNFNTDFNFKQWISVCLSKSGKSFKEIFAKVSLGIFNLLKSFILLIFLGVPKAVISFINNNYRKLTVRKSYQKRVKDTTSSSIYYHGKNLITQDTQGLESLISKTRRKSSEPVILKAVWAIVKGIKNIIFNILYIVLFPIRLLLKYKLIILCFAGSLYLFFYYTSPGKILFYNFFEKDLTQIQSDATNNIKQTTSKVWNELSIKFFPDLRKMAEKGSSKTNAKNTSNIKYAVTASKGLNIRTEPNASSEKLTGKSLEFGSLVEYLGKSSKDTAGRVWYYIQSPDGRIGWVSSKYLEVKKDG